MGTWWPYRSAGVRVALGTFEKQKTHCEYKKVLVIGNSEHLKGRAAAPKGAFLVF